MFALTRMVLFLCGMAHAAAPADSGLDLTVIPIRGSEGAYFLMDGCLKRPIVGPWWTGAALYHTGFDAGERGVGNTLTAVGLFGFGQENWEVGLGFGGSNTYANSARCAENRFVEERCAPPIFVGGLEFRIGKLLGTGVSGRMYAGSVPWFSDTRSEGWSQQGESFGGTHQAVEFRLRDPAGVLYRIEVDMVSQRFVFGEFGIDAALFASPAAPRLRAGLGIAGTGAAVNDERHPGSLGVAPSMTLGLRWSDAVEAPRPSPILGEVGLYSLVWTAEFGMSGQAGTGADVFFGGKHWFSGVHARPFDGASHDSRGRLVATGGWDGGVFAAGAGLGIDGLSKLGTGESEPLAALELRLGTREGAQVELVQTLVPVGHGVELAWGRSRWRAPFGKNIWLLAETGLTAGPVVDVLGGAAYTFEPRALRIGLGLLLGLRAGDGDTLLGQLSIRFEHNRTSVGRAPPPPPVDILPPA